MDDYPYVCPDCKNKDTDKCGWCGDNNNYEPKNMTLSEEKLIEIPEGATNGEVFEAFMCKAYPRVITIYQKNEADKTIKPIFSEDWWNSPYNKGGE